MNVEDKVVIITGGGGGIGLAAARAFAHGQAHVLITGRRGQALEETASREQRVTYRTLRYVFGVDEACLHAVRDELRFCRLAREEDGQGLVWTRDDAPQALSAPRPVPDTAMAHAVLPADDGVSHTPKDMPVLTPAGVHSGPEAERRQLTVLFCDLVGSTQLSGQLDPEDLRAVVCADQEAAAEVIQQYAGLGIVEAIATLNTRLLGQYGVQLAVRLGIHTGPGVVGVMGGGGRHEHLALGEPPNIAARLEGLAPANAVVLSAVTARLVPGTFALEDLGTHTLRGVAEPMTISRMCGLLEAHHTLWITQLLLGELPLSRAHLEQGLALYDPQQHRALAFLYGHDPGVCCRSVAAVARAANHAVTLRAAEREHILRTLEETRWVISGSAGAAARLGLKRTTLQALVKRLGIDRPSA